MLRTGTSKTAAEWESMQQIAGNAGAPGSVHGKIVVLKKQSGQGDQQAPLSLDEARKKCVEQSERLYQRALKDVGEEDAKIFRAYIMLLEDTYLFAPIKARIEKGEPAEAAIREECEKTAAKFASMKQEYMRQRADDIRNVGNMVIDAMKGVAGGIDLPEGDQKVILAAFELTPADTMLLDKSRLGGFITEQGGATSHSVILARTMNIPAVTGVKNLLSVFQDGQDVILDGTGGKIILNPDEETCTKYLAEQQTREHLQAVIASFRSEHAVTADSVPVKLCANIGSPADMQALENEAYDGIGLFRTEFLYSGFDACPTVKQQTEAYRKVFDAAGDREVTVRTADIGGDKSIPYLNLPKEQNPFLGNRGLRLCLERPQLFSEQLQAILTAGAGRNISIMLPMVTELFELRKARDELDKAIRTLHENGIPCCEKIKLGIMVETPSAAVMAESFGACCDFMSIGTNDLTQYVTASDRGNPAVQNLYNPYNPAVIRLIANTASAGKKTGAEVCVCGELGGDPIFMPILLGLGIRKLSMSASHLKRIRFYICHLNSADAEQLAAKVLSMDDSSEIEKEAKSFYKSHMESL